MPTRNEVINKIYCPVCNDDGFIILTEHIKVGEDKEGNPIKMPYQFAYHCPFCEAGKQYAYNGQNCEEKSNYIIPPVTDVLPDGAIEDIKKTNLRRKKQNAERKAERAIKDIKDITNNRIGKYMPGDAYEGKI